MVFNQFKIRLHQVFPTLMVQMILIFSQIQQATGPDFRKVGKSLYYKDRIGHYYIIPWLYTNLPAKLLKPINFLKYENSIWNPVLCLWFNMTSHNLLVYSSCKLYFFYLYYAWFHLCPENNTVLKFSWLVPYAANFQVRPFLLWETKKSLIEFYSGLSFDH